MVYPRDSLTRFVNQIQSSSSHQQRSWCFVPKRLRSSGPSEDSIYHTSGLSRPGNPEPNNEQTLDDAESNLTIEADTDNITSACDEESEEAEQTNYDDQNSTGFTIMKNHSISIRELCTFEILDLLDSFGAPRYSYDKLIALLRRQKKEHGFDVSEAICRDTFLQSLKKAYNCPSIETCIVQNRKVFLFPFVHMLEDLVNDMQVELHTICPSTTSMEIMEPTMNSGTLLGCIKLLRGVIATLIQAKISCFPSFYIWTRLALMPISVTVLSR